MNSQQSHDIKIISTLVEITPAFRRYLSARLRDEAQKLAFAHTRNDWTLVDEYIETLKETLGKVGL